MSQYAYWIAIALHLLAMSLWLGHMFVWSLFVGPAMKRIEPAATAELLRERSLARGGLGWPALAVLVATGAYLLSVRGIGISALLSGAAFQGTIGRALATKFVMVAAMIGYQSVFAHRDAPIAVYFNMLVALIVLAASTVIVRGWV
jgi:uncharacterized membrane protein